MPTSLPRTRLLAAVVSALSLLSACAGQPPLPPIPAVSAVDLERFMGDWYVIASIPTALERDAFNAVERYALDPDGSVRTTFSFRKGGFDGEQKAFHPRGFVVPGTGNAIWKMQFVWPFKADYRIVRLADDYRYTVIGRNKRDYVWIMARTPTLSDQDYEALLSWLAAQSYDTAKIKLVPQRWPN